MVGCGCGGVAQLGSSLLLKWVGEDGLGWMVPSFLISSNYANHLDVDDDLGDTDDDNDHADGAWYEVLAFLV